MNPVQRTLYIRQSARNKSTHERAIRAHTKPNAIDNPFITDSRARKHINIRMHSWMNAMQLGFAKIGHRPPDTGVDEGKDLLPCVRVGPARNREIGHASIKRSVYAGVVEV